MLEQLSRHSLMDLMVRAKGDLHIDNHHTTEDTGIAIGEAINKSYERSPRYRSIFIRHNSYGRNVNASFD